MTLIEFADRHANGLGGLALFAMFIGFSYIASRIVVGTAGNCDCDDETESE